MNSHCSLPGERSHSRNPKPSTYHNRKPVNTSGRCLLQVRRRFLIVLLPIHHPSDAHAWKFTPFTLHSEHALLALFLATNRTKGSDSDWSHYINFLPQTFDTVAAQMPAEFLELLPLEIQGNESMHQDHALRWNSLWYSTAICTKQLTQVRDDYKKILSYLQLKKLGDAPTYTDFSWAWFAGKSHHIFDSSIITSNRLYLINATVNTRCITLHTSLSKRPKSGESTIALAPLLDILNHSESARVNDQSDSIRKMWILIVQKARW